MQQKFNFLFWNQLRLRHVCVLMDPLKGTPESYFCIKIPPTHDLVLSQYVGALPALSNGSNGLRPESMSSSLTWKMCSEQLVWGGKQGFHVALQTFDVSLRLSGPFIFVKCTYILRYCPISVGVALWSKLSVWTLRAWLSLDRKYVRVVLGFCFRHAGLVPKSASGSSTRPWGFIPAPGVSCSGIAVISFLHSIQSIIYCR